MKLPAICAANVALAIAIGAFGAHALKDRITPELLEVFKTGHSYHLGIGIAAFLLALIAAEKSERFLSKAVGALLVGTVIFSGSLYALALTGIRIFGAITPLGGLLWIGTWTAVAVYLWNKPMGTQLVAEPSD